MGREGHGCGAGSGAGRQGAYAHRRIGRSGDEGHQSGQDESAAVVMFACRVATVDASRGSNGASLPDGRRRNMQRLALLAAVIALIATPATAQPGLTKVRVAYDGFSMTSGPLIYADKQGIFKK